jgi:hypothetical protein
MAQRARLRRPWEEAAVISERERDGESSLKIQGPDSPATSELERLPQTPPSLHPQPPQSQQWHASKGTYNTETSTNEARSRQPSDLSLPGIESFGSKRPRLDVANDYGVSREVCCGPNCSGPKCDRLRILTNALIEEIGVHENLVHGSGMGVASGAQEHAVVIGHDTAILGAVQQALDRLKLSNASLQTLLKGMDPAPAPTHNRQSSLFSQTVVPPIPVSVTTSSVSGPALTSPNLPSQQAVQPPSSGPSNLPAGLTLPSTVPELQAALNSIHQTVSHTRAKLHTFERKSAVASAEIISLANERDRLESHVEFLERQCEKLTQARDDARRAGSVTAQQYLKIVETAGKLKGKGGEDPLVEPENMGWEREREELLDRIRELEAGAERSKDVLEDLPPIPPGETSSPLAVVTRLKDEIERLRQRNQRLEDGVKTAKKIASLVTEQGQSMEKALNIALERA